MSCTTPAGSPKRLLNPNFSPRTPVKRGSTPSSSKYCLVCGIILRNENFYAFSRPELLCALNVILQGVQRMCLYRLKKEKVPVAVPLSAYLSLKNLSTAGRKTTLFPGDRMNMPQLFVHTAGRRLDQRLKRLLAVVSLP